MPRHEEASFKLFIDCFPEEFDTLQLSLTVSLDPFIIRNPMNSVELQNLQKTMSDDTTLLAVSKTVPTDVLRQAYNLGLRQFGENRVKDLLSKRQELLDLDIKWHYIGQLQSNKAASLVGKVALIHTLDRIKIWNILKGECARLQTEQDCLVQVNISLEPQKAGLAPQDLYEFLEKIDTDGLQFCKIKGLMCIGSPLHIVGESRVRSEFKSMLEMFQELKNRNFEQVRMDILSMGMSVDYPLALEFGSTLVRIGSAIFGPRRNKEYDHVT